MVAMEQNKNNKLSTASYFIAAIVFFSAFGNIFYMKSFKKNLNKSDKSANLVLHPESVIFSSPKGTSNKYAVIQHANQLDENRIVEIRKDILKKSLKAKISKS